MCIQFIGTSYTAVTHRTSQFLSQSLPTNPYLQVFLVKVSIASYIANRKQVATNLHKFGRLLNKITCYIISKQMVLVILYYKLEQCPKTGSTFSMHGS